MQSRARFRSVVILLGVLPSLGASYRTENFQVEAPTADVARQIGQAAERCRKEQAQAWLGKELPAWPEPCPIRVKITLTGFAGCTTVTFDRGKVIGHSLSLEGRLDRLLTSTLPHESTHLILAHHLGRPVPRWADEGGAAMAETSAERSRHDEICREVMNTPGRAIPLRRLLPQRDYPGDVTALYAQGQSLVTFLVASSNRPAFLAFLAQGMRNDDWDAAVQTHYSYRSVEELEKSWRRSQDQTVVRLALDPKAVCGVVQRLAEWTALAVRISDPQLFSDRRRSDELRAVVGLGQLNGSER